MCEAPLRVEKTIEVGHIFKLGTRYSELLDATVQDERGESRPIVMGSYGIGVERTMAAVVERCHDDAGIVWPISVAPFEVVVTVLNPKDAAPSDAGAGIYDALTKAGIDVLFDDRDERPGVKFKDADLIGVPYRITVGPKGLAQGKVEVLHRKGRQSRSLDVNKAADEVADLIMEERSFAPRV